eukprot:7380577-Prymnesium_polylepis.2
MAFARSGASGRSAIAQPVSVTCLMLVMMRYTRRVLSGAIASTNARTGQDSLAVQRVVEGLPIRRNGEASIARPPKSVIPLRRGWSRRTSLRLCHVPSASRTMSSTLKAAARPITLHTEARLEALGPCHSHSTCEQGSPRRGGRGGHPWVSGSSSSKRPRPDDKHSDATGR